MMESEGKKGGLQCNTSIQTMNFSDNALVCQDGQIICEFLKHQAEVRDQQLWELGLRGAQVEKHFTKIKAECLREQQESTQ